MSQQMSGKRTRTEKNCFSIGTGKCNGNCNQCTVNLKSTYLLSCTGKSLSEALLFAEHGENMLCTKIVLNVRNNFCTQQVLPRFELGIFMY